MKSLRIHWALWLAIILFLAGTFVLLSNSARQNDGRLIYALDDAYIHMAMAKNFSQYGVWGVTRYEFSSATSSPGWVLLLSLVYVIVGVNEYAPFVINLLCAIGILTLVYRRLRAAGGLFTLLVLAAMIFCTPFFTLLFNGMEHLLHILVLLALVIAAVDVLTEEKATRRITPASPRARLLIFSALAMLVRYESIFIIAVIGLLLMLRGRWLSAVLSGMAAFLPVGIYGAISVANGWYFIPNSVLLKSEGTFYVIGDPIAFWLYGVFEKIAKLPDMLTLVLLMAVALVFGMMRYKLFWHRLTLPLVLLLPAFLLHLRFGGAGNFYRYEAYLVALGIFGVALVFTEVNWKAVLKGGTFAPALFTLLTVTYLALPLGARTVNALREIVPSTTNIYQQQYQMGLFVREYYSGATIALNDIGAVSYLADIHLIDLFGLATMDVARAKQTGLYDTNRIAQIASNAQIAIVYYTWFRQGLPEGWLAIGDWRAPFNVVLGSDTITFYALHQADENTLLANLLAFSSRLPTDVIELGEYSWYVALADTLGLFDLEDTAQILTDDAGLAAHFEMLGLLSPAVSERVVVLDGMPAPENYTLFTSQSVYYRGEERILEIYVRPPETLHDWYTFGGTLTLRAWSIVDSTLVDPCDSVGVESWWQANSPLSENLRLTVAFMRDTIEVVQNNDLPPVSLGDWQIDTLYVDARRLTIPCDTPAGNYGLFIGVFNAQDGNFLPISIGVPLRPTPELLAGLSGVVVR